MRTRRSWLVAIVVGAIAAAATVDAFVSADPEPATPRAATGGRTPTVSDTDAAQAGTFSIAQVREYKMRQLELRADVRDDVPAVVLFHRAGRECRLRPPLRITVRIVSASGAKGEGTVFGPEPDVFRGVFESAISEVAAFRYSPACGEEPPFFATVTARRYVVKMRIPVVRCGQVIAGGS